MDWRMEQHKFHVPKFGCGALYFGRKFKFTKNPKLNSVYIDAEKMNSSTAGYVIVGLARHFSHDKLVLCFKFYDAVKHRVAPQANSGQWYYIPCKYLMSTDNRECCMELLAVYGGVIDPTGLSLVNRHIVMDNERGVVKQYIVKGDMYNVEFNLTRRENLTLLQLLPCLR